MGKVVIVDDEYIAAEGLVRLVEWKEYDLEVACIAYDGVSALSAILDVKPDIVFTDIRMPGLSGLDLIQAAKSRLPGTVFVIISGYNDFEYIRKAIHLNVFDYLDKPITIEKVTEILRRYRNMGAPREGPDGDVVKRLFEETLELSDMPPGDARGRIAALWRPARSGLPAPRFVAGVALEGGNEKVIGASLDALEARLKPLGAHVAGLNRPGGCLALLYSPAECSMEGVRREIKRWLDAELSRDAGLRVGSGNGYGSASDIPRTVGEAQKALKYGMFFDESCIFIGDVEVSLSLPGDLAASENDLYYHLRVGDRAKAKELVRSIMSSLEAANVSMELFCHVSLELIYLGQRVCREVSAGYVSDIIPHVEIGSQRTAQDIADWVERKYEDMFDWLEKQRQGIGWKNVDKARKYIDEHYGEEITLDQLADMLGMNPTYFSMLFKTRVGQTYVKYLNQVRMERARESLINGISIKNVCARVGFSSQRYFCDRFKGYWGCTPSQLRNHEAK